MTTRNGWIDDSSIQLDVLAKEWYISRHDPFACRMIILTTLDHGLTREIRWDESLTRRLE